MKIKVKVCNKSRNPLPKYETDFSAGIDLMANVAGEDKLIIHPGQRRLISTGLFVAIPEGYELQIRPRSGLALKKGISIVNSPGTIDSDYRGDVGVIVINHGEEAISFGNGDRIAQAVLAPVSQLEFEEVPTWEELPTTDRGTGGFGSTGINTERKE